MTTVKQMNCKLVRFGRCVAEKIKVDGKAPFTDCTWCHKPLKGTFWFVTSEEGYQEYFGCNCFKNLLLEEYK